MHNYIYIKPVSNIYQGLTLHYIILRYNNYISQGAHLLHGVVFVGCHGGGLCWQDVGGLLTDEWADEKRLGPRAGQTVLTVTCSHTGPLGY